MNDEDLRDLFAGMALQRVLWFDGREEEAALRCYVMAGAMIEAKYAEKEIGIKAVKPKRKKVGDE